MVYKEVRPDASVTEREEEVSRLWEEEDVFKRSIKDREGCPTYMFFDGPPTANGKPHIGHVETRVIKDMIPRFRTMKGYRVPRKAGWDTHGLPVELEVEKLLGLNGKEQIEKYGMEPFIEKCKESVWKFKGMWETFSKKVGFWADMDDPYVTYDNNFIESEWWALKEISKKGLLYKGHKIVPYCPRCGTPLSSHEVAQGYKNVKERSAVVRFKAVDGDYYFLAWTTTPWTLPSNTALCVNPDEEYVKVNAADGKTYILAKALADKVLGSLAEEGKKAYEIIETYKGSDLKGLSYEPLYECAGNAAKAQKKKAHFIVADDYVTMSDGTGIVHIAPAFGEDDNRVGRDNDLPFIQFVNEKGELTAETPFAGLFVKKADPEVLEDLEHRGLLFDAPKFEHDYPYCWRCDTPLIYYARDTWFIKMTAVKDELLKNNDTVNWIPESIGKGRFGDWLKNVQDWGISRNRYWGTPLPVWECECGERHVVGSIAELKEMSDDCPEDIELHRPFVDNVTIRCPKCGKPMKRVSEVIDCWFDSGAMPYAQHHYPFENKDKFEDQFPADFISEAVDQTRGWFYSLMAESTILFGKAPYKNVIVLGLVLDENGQKMSKSKGNAVDPMDALNKHGADAVRWYFYSNSAPWLPNRFYDKAVAEGQSKFLSTLWNTYSFFVLYANIDEFDASKYSLCYDKLPLMDKWLLSRLHSTIKAVDDNLTNYRVNETAKVLQDFVDDMSNWYVRRCRARFWAKGMEQDKINAYMTLYTALIEISKVAAPMVPFITESIYQNLVRNIDDKATCSIHLCDFPKVKEEWINKNLEKEMEDVLEIVVLGRAGRNEANIKNRQPIGNMYVKIDDESAKLEEGYIDIIKEELNVKRVEMIDNVDRFSSYAFKPQLRTLGKRFGKNLNALKEVLAAADGNKLMADLKAEGKTTVTVNGVDEVLEEADLLYEPIQVEGYETTSDHGVTVVLDKHLSADLITEGYIREIISKIQNMRKEVGFEVMDLITIYANGNQKIENIMSEGQKEILTDVMATKVVTGTMEGFSKEWNINGEKVTLGVKKNQ